MPEVHPPLSGFFDLTEFPREVYEEWAARVHESRASREEFEDLLKARRSAEASGREALSLGIAHLILGRLGDAEEVLTRATDNKYRRFYAAQVAESVGRVADAIAELERAESRGWDAFDVQMRIAALHVRDGQLDAARRLLKSHAAGKDRADWHYVDGLVHDADGDHAGAIEAFDRALALAPDDARILFRCAYLCDLYGDDERAIELYEALSLQPAAHVHALMNLAVIYEDAGEYERALSCLRRVLAVNPNHVRARLFLKDVESSVGMVIDEDHQKRSDSQSKLRDTPISEFELSVRSRNCLKKMNINTLGDLLRITEAELLAYKNFGETSLNEIKALLASRNLKLGQSLDGYETAAPPPPPPLPVHVPPGAEAVLDRPVAELELSVRARKCLQRLNVNRIGELITRTETELLAIRNFGQTSLAEIKSKLAEFGLTLAGSKA